MKKFIKLLMAATLTFSTVSMSMIIPVSATQDISIDLASMGDGSENLALNKTATSSSNEGTSGRYPDAAVDGNASSRWASAAGVDESGIDETWFQVDLGSEAKVNKVVISWESRPNKFQIQVSLDGTTWTNVGDEVDNGYYTSGADKMNTIEFETTTARYVRMQGIQRRRKSDENGGASNRTGYSIYELEIYGPAWDDSRFISEYLTTLNVKSRVSKDFTLPVKDDDYGVTITWESDNDAITVDQNGKVTIKRSEKDVKTVLTATVKRGEKSDTKDFEVTVASNTGKEYEFSPIPQNVIYNSGSLEISETVNLVFEDDVETNVKDKYIDILEDNDIDYHESENIDNQNMNLIIGTQNDSGIVENYFKDVDYHKDLSTNHDEGYVLDVNVDDNIVAILGSDDSGTLYGGYTLLDILEQGEGVVREVRVEDYPDTQFRGFIEGFYGSWSHENRKSLLEFCGRYKMNTYIYGPKNDPYHYGQWKDMYPADKLNELKELVEVGKQSGVEFVWAAHVGGHTDLSDTDIEALEAKFDQLYNIGVRQFALFFDDSSTNNTRLVEYMNKIQTEYIEQKEGVKPLIFCPQYYRKQGASESYLRNLAKFDKDIQIMWTGDYVVSEINQSVIDWITHIIERDVFIWWNWPVNDLGRSGLMHLGPTEAIENNIQKMSGLTSNPMNQAQASKVSLYSIADYTWNIGDYDSQSSWLRAIHHIITDDEDASNAFAIFAQNCAAAPMSFPKTDESVYMKKDIASLKEKILNGEDYSQEVENLKADLQELRDAITTLKAYKGTNNISGEIDPWMNVVDKIAAAGCYVLDNLSVFESLDPNNDDSLKAAMDVIEQGRSKLYSSNGGKKAAQKVLYPFIDELINILEAQIYDAIDLEYPNTAYGSFNVDYAKAIDKNTSTYATLGQYTTDNYFGINLGNVIDIQTIDINMAETNGSKKGYFKKGVLEYSIDNVHWTKIGEYDLPIIHEKVENINARYIRYRALDVWEDEVTGENLSNILLNEISVNQGLDYHEYSEPNASLTLTKNNNVLSVSSNENITLKPEEYVGVRFDVLKNIQMIKSQDNHLTLEASDNGVNWTKQDFNTLKNFEAKYIRLINHTNENITLNKLNADIQFVGNVDLQAKLSETIINDKGNGIYSGNANNLVDGNENTTLWLKRGVSGNDRYIELSMPDVVSVNDLQVLYKGDNANGGHVDVSIDGTHWETVYEFNRPNSLLQKINLEGVNAKYIRYYINTGEWSQIAEMYVNRDLDENASTLEGSLSDLNKLTDKDIFSKISAGNQSGEIIYDCINNMYPKNIYLLKNKDTTVQLQAKIKGEWKDIKSLDKIYNVVDMSEIGFAEQLKLTWDSNVTFNELWLKGTVTTDKEQLQKLYDTKDQYQENMYEEETWAPYQDALDEAEEVLNNPYALQSNIDNAYANLRTKIQELEFKDADYSKVNEAITKANALNKDNYKDFSKVEKALADVKTKLKINEQTKVDAMAKAIEDAIDALELKGADYTKVDEALKTIPSDLSAYTNESVKALNDAIMAVDRSKTILEQEKVDAYAKAIHKAIQELKEKTTITIDDTEEIKDIEKDNKVSTGDSTNMMLFAGMTGLSLLGIAVMISRKKREI